MQRQERVHIGLFLTIPIYYPRRVLLTLSPGVTTQLVNTALLLALTLVKRFSFLVQLFGVQKN